MKKPDQRLRQLFALTLPVDGFTSGKNEMKQIQNWKCNLRKTPDKTSSCALLVQKPIHRKLNGQSCDIALFQRRDAT